jgi:ferric-dicitrate binding protein FerR (iron transport regulator)
MQLAIHNAAMPLSADAHVSIDETSMVVGEDAGESLADTSPVDESPSETGAANRFSKRLVYRLISRAAIAAGVIGVVLLTYLSYQPQNVQTSAVVNDDQAVSKRLATVLRHEENKTEKTRRLKLPDGSEVMLAPESAIEFEEPFSDGRREITLYGKAEFEVQKDTVNPFIVHSDQLSTTALGTRFSVTSFAGSRNILIQLFEGRVMVESGKAALTRLKQVYYLLPGEDLLYVKGSSKATVRRSGSVPAKRPGATVSTTADEPFVPYSGQGSWYMFNNQALPEVFQRLEMLYNVPIKFSAKDLRNIYFIGRFKQTDSLDKILNEIVEINGLKLDHKNGTFIITK